MNGKVEMCFICQHCNQEFITKSKLQIYCSHKCAQNFRNARIKASKIKIDSTQCDECNKEIKVNIINRLCRDGKKRCKQCLNKQHYEISKINGTTIKHDRRKHLKKKHKMTLEAFEELKISQSNKCAICQITPNEHLCVDHNHKTNKIRGLLCRQCNTGLGQFRDNIENLKTAIEYLKKEFINENS